MIDPEINKVPETNKEKALKEITPQVHALLLMTENYQTMRIMEGSRENCEKCLDEIFKAVASGTENLDIRSLY